MIFWRLTTELTGVKRLSRGQCSDKLGAPVRRGAFLTDKAQRRRQPLNVVEG
jgi:hypothetical protein